MRRIFLLLAAGALASAIAQARAEDCSLKQIANLPLQRGPNELPLVPVSLGGKSILMLLDTGAARGVIDATLAQQMGLPAFKISQPQPIFVVPGRPLLDVVQFHSANMYLSNGTQLDHFATVPSLDIGASHSTDVKFLLAGIDEPTTPTLKGILGSNLLRNFDVEIDPRAGKVNLFSPNHCARKVVYWSHEYSELPVQVTDDGALEFVMALNGEDLDAVLDTGASNTSLPIPTARRRFDIDTDSSRVEHVSGDGANAIFRIHFKTLAAGGISVINPEIYLTPDLLGDRLRHEASEARQIMPTLIHKPQLVLGMDVLSKLHIYIAYGERTIYVTASDAGAIAATPTASKRPPH